jgi:hypothetical protein
MYFHNIKAGPALGRGGACMHTDSAKVNSHTFATPLRAAGCECWLLSLPLAEYLLTPCPVAAQTRWGCSASI